MRKNILILILKMMGVTALVISRLVYTLKVHKIMNEACASHRQTVKLLLHRLLKTYINADSYI